MPVAVVTDTTHYAPRELIEAQRHPRGQPLRQRGRRAASASRTSPTSTRSTTACAPPTDLPTTSQPSIGDFLEVYEPLAEAGHDIVSVHLAGGISGTVESARQAADELEARAPAARASRSSTRARRAARWPAPRSPAPPPRAPAATSTPSPPRVARGQRQGEALVRRRHARVPAPRRAHRRRPGLARRRAEDQADPDASTARSRPIERVRTAGPRVRAHGRLPALAAGRRRRRLDRPAHPGATSRPSALVERGREIFGSEPVFVSEIGPVIGTHVGPGLLGVGGGRRAARAC